MAEPYYCDGVLDKAACFECKFRDCVLPDRFCVKGGVPKDIEKALHDPDPFNEAYDEKQAEKRKKKHEWYLKNKKSEAERVKKWKEKNKERVAEHTRRYREKLKKAKEAAKNG